MKKNIKEMGKLTIALTVLALFVSVASAQPIATDFGVNDISGDPNTFVLVPVNLTNVQNESIAGIVFDISFDPSVINLTKDRVKKGDLTSAWDSPSLNPANGRISIVFGGSGTEIPINGSGSVVVLNFSVVGAPGAKSAMNISGIQLSGLEGVLGTASAKNGTFIITGSAVVTSITISPSTAMLTDEETQTFTAKALDQNDAPIAGIGINFTSDNTTVGTVAPENMMTGADGIATTTFTALANGIAMVIAANGSVVGNATVTVSIVDIIAPVTIISGVTENGSFNNSVTVTLNATDNPEGSGVNETFYMVNGGPTITYSVPFVVDTVGSDNVTYWSTDIAGNVEPQKMVNFTIVNISQVNATATREIERKFILPGESTNITVRISGNANALALHEIPPEGWNVTRGTDSAYAFKNSTNEWIWKSMEANETVTYTLTAPENISIGTYQIEGTITDANGILLANVEGDNTVKIDIISPVTMISGVTENGSFNNSVTVTLNATDNPGGSGVNETLYMVNGGPITTYSEPFVVDTVGSDNVTYWSTDIAGNVEPQNTVNFTIVILSENANATRKIKSKSILPGESTIITVSIARIVNASALHEIPPEGWNVTRGTDNADAFKNSTNEWVWKSTESNKTVIYTLTAPGNISIGTYQIEGIITDANGKLANVEGDNIVKIDILEFYRRLGIDPGVVETMDLLRAFDDFINNIVPQGFDRPLSTEEVNELVNEWRKS